jgi:branched-chain amino acid transport system permease protein
MLTLALGQLLIEVVSLDDLRSVTGGSDGLVVTYSGSLGSLTPTDIGNPTLFWPVVWTVAILAVLAVYIIAKTRLGRILRGIRENEPRMQHAGFNTYVPKLLAFAFAGFLGAIGGVLQATRSGFVSPDLISFGASGNAIIAALIGGYTAPVGALIGGILLIWGEDKFGASGQLYLYTGIALIVVLVVFPKGIVGVAEFGWRQVKRGYRQVGRGRRVALDK